MSKWTNTSFTRRLGVAHPIIHGPFGRGSSSVRLTAAVSNTGGLGSFGASDLGSGDVFNTAVEIRKLTHKPFAPNLWVSTFDGGGDTLDEASYERLIKFLAPYYCELGVTPPPKPNEIARKFQEQVAALLEQPELFATQICAALRSLRSYTANHRTKGDSPINTTKISEEIKYDRRRFLSTAVMTIAAAEFGMFGSADAQSGATTPAGATTIKPAPNTSCGPLKQIDAGVLSVGYAEAGPDDGPPVLLLHGFPYSIDSYVEVAPMLAARGCRVIVPHLRGHGSTRFLDSGTPRSGQQGAIGVDVIALMDALKLNRAVLAGYDWGGRAACVAAALWPERCTGLVSVNSYLIQDIAKAGVPLPPSVEAGLWYQYYFQTERGRAGLTANRREIARTIWMRNSPNWRFDEATLNRHASAFDNPDYVDVVIHSYRHRLGLAAGYSPYEDVERRLAALPAITVPTITIDGRADGVVPANDGRSSASKFSGSRSHRVVEGAGHNLPEESPREFADAVWELASAKR